jgi:hypothetical protein
VVADISLSLSFPKGQVRQQRDGGTSKHACGHPIFSEVGTERSAVLLSPANALAAMTAPVLQPSATP